MNENPDDFFPEVVAGARRWASPKEFDGGKEIMVLNFECLSLAEVTTRDGRPPKFPPPDGTVRRLTFKEMGAPDEEQRTLDINSAKFQKDLAGKGIRQYSTGVLSRAKIQNSYGYTWSWRPTA